jgi:hypothetical protein
MPVRQRGVEASRGRANNVADARWRGFLLCSAPILPRLERLAWSVGMFQFPFPAAIKTESGRRWSAAPEILLQTVSMVVRSYSYCRGNGELDGSNW